MPYAPLLSRGTKARLVSELQVRQPRSNSQAVLGTSGAAWSSGYRSAVGMRVEEQSDRAYLRALSRTGLVRW